MDITYLARTNFRGLGEKFGIRGTDRRQHVYVIGKTGVGKTALLKNMALQDVERGAGLAIVDPHGEFVEEVLDNIPRHRLKDVVYFNPADTEYPISFNILEVPDLKYKHLVVSGLIGVFTKIWANVWSARMEYILSNCILALLDTPGTTLLGILRILVDRDYRQQIVDNLKDPVVKSFWVNEYAAWPEKYRNEAIAPIQNKVGQFLNVALVRNIVGQPKSTIDIPNIMDKEKILLVNVSKGRVGEDNSALLGAMLITKIQLAAMERVRIPEEQRKDFYLYVDEFQNFATSSFASILSEARKYRLNLTIAHQYIGQLIGESTTEVRDAVFGNVGTLISFRVGAEDAEFLEKEFNPEFFALDLVNLPNYNIYLKLMIDGVSSRPFSAQTLVPMSLGKEKSIREEIIQFSRANYSMPIDSVEKIIARWSGVMESNAVVPSGAFGLHDAVCSLCGKKTKVTFVPDPKRPVYCKSCKKKIDEGRAEVPEEFQKKWKNNEARNNPIEELEKLGIGLGITTQTQAHPTSTPTPAKPSSLTPISLKDAIKKEPQSFNRKRKKINVHDLRKALKDSLDDKTNNEDHPR